MHPDKKRQLYALLSALREEVITDDQLSELDEMICTDRSVAREYVDYVKLWTELYFFQAASRKSFINSPYGPDTDSCQFLSDAQVWRELAKYEKHAPPIAVEPDEPSREPIQKVVREKTPYRLSTTSIVSLTACAAMVLFAVMFVKFVPDKGVPVEVATLTDQIDVQWMDPRMSLQTGTRLWNHDRPLKLEHGIISLRYDDETEVVVEGPAVVELERGGLYLEYGRLYSRVSNHGLGFTIQTPTSRFVDYGTAFGVQADIDGSTELHVFTGKVQVFAGAGGHPRVSQMVHKNEAVRYEVSRNSVYAIPIRQEAYARRIESAAGTVWRGQTALDLADIVARGNGLGTGNKHSYLNPQTGRYVDQWFVHAGTAEFDSIHAVPENRFIDSVFIPDGGPDKRVRISSTDLVFADCPPTSGSFSDFIQVTENPDYRKLYQAESHFHPDRDAFIYMHSNLGMTIDLDALRRAFPEFQLEGFRTRCGITQKVLRMDGTEYDRDFRVVFHLLLDGHRMAEIPMRVGDIPVSVAFSIGEEHRFLTLVVTDGGDGRLGDRAFFIEPEIGISTVE